MTSREARAPIFCGRQAAVSPHGQSQEGILVATRSVWLTDFQENLTAALDQLGPDEAVDLGCVVTKGAFESGKRGPHFSPRSESRICFMIRLIERLRALGNAPAVDLMSYGRTLESFRSWPGR